MFKSLSLITRLFHRFMPGGYSAIKVGMILWKNLGWLQTFKSKTPTDRSGDPLPWMTYPVISWLKSLDFSHCRVFEYGAGWGTLFWASRAQTVVSVEQSEQWVQRLRPWVPSNVQLYGPLNGSPYIECSRNGGPWDVIVVDGSDRLSCAQVAVGVLAPDGIIVLDNSDWFVDAADFLRSKDFTQIDFQGFGPCNDYTWTTSVFFRRGIGMPRISGVLSCRDDGSIPYKC